MCKIWKHRLLFIVGGGCIWAALQATYLGLPLPGTIFFITALALIDIGDNYNKESK